MFYSLDAFHSFLFSFFFLKYTLAMKVFTTYVLYEFGLIIDNARLFVYVYVVRYGLSLSSRVARLISSVYSN